MEVTALFEELQDCGIDTVVGVPDSLLAPFCACLQTMEHIHHYTAPNEGAAVAIAAGSYLACRRPSLVYMQNSGIGNAINPIASLLHEDVYQIPMLFLIGWRGEPETKDEPQHKFQGKVTCRLMEDMDIPYAIISKETTRSQLRQIFEKASAHFKQNRQFAIIVKKQSLHYHGNISYQNENQLNREQAIRTILQNLGANDVIVSTTGKISREVYEQSNDIFHTHDRMFLTVGSMGHASMIAYGLSEQLHQGKIVCVDGDGAVLMHMGTLAFLGKQQPKHYLHIVLNNAAHESVGGMPTGAAGQSYAAIAKACGYPKVFQVDNASSFVSVLQNAQAYSELTMIEVMVKLGARDDLGRPKETPQENKERFMNYWEEHTK
ncbi:MAG: phosphonopyruvate decarboxylase [Erysipelotrichaceae bacterium]|nr:phosphonopyruvate decarboxylase [Erysipelotrichaceae bacterium]MCI9525174.1 phosphonopyruvate decarboxylase [Erysipelotrichaceae bacterium]